MFSILIPTWNNLELLKLCVRSIRENSKHPHQIIIHVNDGSDGTLEWVRTQQLDYTHSPQNVGICLAVNEAAMLARQDYILYLNDDMYCCPGWDTALIEKLKGLDTDLFMLSGTMIEPRNTNNPCVIVRDYGSDVANFDEARLLAELPQQSKNDWYGATWPPTLVSRRWWFMVTSRRPPAGWLPHLSGRGQFAGLSLPVQVHRQSGQEQRRQTVPAQVGNAPIGI